MNGFVFQSPGMLLLLLVIPLVVLLVRYGFKKKNEALVLLGGECWSATLMNRFLIAISLGLLLLVFALARPGWGVRKEPLTQKGRDVIFVLDVSRSMLAEDRVPNRIENAKRAILDCVETLEGNRVGLLAFAGSASIRAPLSSDYVFFRKMIDELSYESVDQGGTRIGDALRKVADKFLSDEMQGYQDVILLTDGGDQESQPADAVALLNEKKASLLVIGLGSEGQGVRIPVVDEATGHKTFLLDGERELWTRQESSELESLVFDSENGLFLNATTRALDLYDVYSRFVQHSEERLVEGVNRERVDEKFQWFLAPAFLLLVLAGLILNRPHAVIAVLVFFSSPGSLRADSFAEAKDLYASENYEDAMRLFEQASLETKQNEARADALFRAGNASFHLASDPEVSGGQAMISLVKATRYYRAALDLEEAHVEAGFNLELARYRWQELKTASEQDEQENDDGEEQDSSEETSEGDESSDDMGEEDEYGDEEDYDGDANDYSDSSSPTSMTDLNNQDVPPPNVSPQDLLDEEIANQEVRQKKRSGKKTEVKKDW